jgi:putative endonuclease
MKITRFEDIEAWQEARKLVKMAYDAINKSDVFIKDFRLVNQIQGKDLKLRFEQHDKGLVESTRDRRPLRLIYYEACLVRTDATRREKYLKTYHGKMFLKRRLKSYLTG